ncbi:hypothetical protein ASC80_07100 [Afipia sp. Root123D2]|nr:hypothetical protein ASC80_07100 [Afipia sp. Root123D2]
MSPQNFEPRRSRCIGRVAMGLVALLVSATLAAAQTKTVERTVRGPTAKDIRVGVYLNVQADCTTGVLPSIRLVASPANGTVNVKRGKVTATHYKQCMALEVPSFIAFYRSKANFVGTDTLTLEVKYPQGRTELQRITVKVGDASAPWGRNI